MKLLFTAYGNIQTATEDSSETYEFNAGDKVDVPDEIAALFLNYGVAEPVKATKATKTAGETATE